MSPWLIETLGILLFGLVFCWVQTLGILAGLME